MAKTKNNYFEMLEKQFSHCVQAADMLEEIICNFSKDTIEVQMNRIHEVEHNADMALREISNCLSREFITPIDQSDIYRLANKLDDVTDWVEEAVILLHMFDMDKVPPHGVEMARTVRRSVNALNEAVKELKNFKKPEKLMQKIIEVNNIESESDHQLLQAINELFRSNASAKELISYKTLYDCLENCTDVAESAADLIERVVIKNS